MVHFRNIKLWSQGGSLRLLHLLTLRTLATAQHINITEFTGRTSIYLLCKALSTFCLYHTLYYPQRAKKWRILFLRTFTWCITVYKLQYFSELYFLNLSYDHRLADSLVFYLSPCQVQEGQHSVSFYQRLQEWYIIFFLI